MMETQMEFRHFAGVDPAEGGIGRVTHASERKMRDADDFSMSVWRDRVDGSGVPELVKIIRENGLTAPQMSAIIHREHMAFGFEMIMMDPNGGGLSVRDQLREPLQDDNAEKFNVVPLITEDDTQMQGVGESRLVLFGRSDSRIRRSILSLNGESFLINKAHEVFRAALEGTPQRARFPSIWEGWGRGGHQFDTPDKMRLALNSQLGLTGRSRVAAEIDLMLFQLITIERKMGPDGVKCVQDKHGQYEFTSSCKKDAAYATIYGYFALWLAREERKMQENSTPKEPAFVIAVQDA